MDNLCIEAIKKDTLPILLKFFFSQTGRQSILEKDSYLIEKYPSNIAFLNNEVVGFSYSKSFAPDILELLNIHIHMSYRNNSLGTKLLVDLEKKAIEKFNAIILVNSTMYSNKDDKKDASNFYLKNHYKIIGETDNTKIFYKIL